MTRTQARQMGDFNARFLLDSLKAAHANLLAAIEELNRLTQLPLPPAGLLINVRWNVSKASLDRRLLWGRIHLELSRRVESASEDALRRLQDIDMELLQASSAHVTKWTPNAIQEDWEGYCKSSANIRRKMVEAIESETRLLYPILRSLGQSS